MNFFKECYKARMYLFICMYVQLRIWFKEAARLAFRSLSLLDIEIKPAAAEAWQLTNQQRYAAAPQQL